MNDTVKSVFRQREIEKLYELSYSCGHIGYVYNYDSNVYLTASGNENKVINDKVIGSYDIEIPMLEIGEKFFLHNIQEVIRIKSKMRSSDGSITYYVEDKVVETENTKKTYDECREKIEHWKCEKEKFDKLNGELESCKKELEEYKSAYKYKHRFFNFVY